MSQIDVRLDPTGQDGRITLAITSDPVTIAAMLGDLVTYFEDPAAIMESLTRNTDFPYREGV
jgi:hypothetical protein